MIAADWSCVGDQTSTRSACTCTVALIGSMRAWVSNGRSYAAVTTFLEAAMISAAFGSSLPLTLPFCSSSLWPSS